MTAAKKAAAKPQPDEKSVLLDPGDREDVTTFDVNAWLDDARVPQRSTNVYKRADVIGRLDELQREAEEAGGESSLADNAEWVKLAKILEESRVTITVRAMSKDTAMQARRDSREERDSEGRTVQERAQVEWVDEGFAADAEDRAGDEADIEELEGEDREALIRRRVIEARRRFIDAKLEEAVEEHLLARLIVSPKMNVHQVRKLSEQIGFEHAQRVARLARDASGEVRVPTAPFSQPSSKGRRGGASSRRSGQRGTGASRR